MKKKILTPVSLNRVCSYPEKLRRIKFFDAISQQAFAQGQYKPSNNITLNAGVHYFRLAHNNTSSVEPRFSAKWNINNKSSIAVGYGLLFTNRVIHLLFIFPLKPNHQCNKSNTAFFLFLSLSVH